MLRLAFCLKISWGVSWDIAVPRSLSVLKWESSTSPVLQVHIECFEGKVYRGTSLIGNSNPPCDQHRALGIVLL